MNRLLSLAVLLLLCGCQIQVENRAPISEAPVPPLPIHPLRGKSNLPRRPAAQAASPLSPTGSLNFAKTKSITLSWIPAAGPVTILQSGDMASWETLARSDSTSLVLTNDSPSRFFKVAADSALTLTWDASPTPNVIGYQLYWGVAPRAYTNAMISQTPVFAVIPGLQPQTTYYFAVTSLGENGLESDFSQEISYTTPQQWVTRVPAQIHSP